MSTPEEVKKKRESSSHRVIDYRKWNGSLSLERHAMSIIRAVEPPLSEFPSETEVKLWLQHSPCVLGGREIIDIPGLPYDVPGTLRFELLTRRLHTSEEKWREDIDKCPEKSLSVSSSFFHKRADGLAIKSVDMHSLIAEVKSWCNEYLYGEADYGDCT